MTNGQRTVTTMLAVVSVMLGVNLIAGGMPPPEALKRQPRNFRQVVAALEDLQAQIFKVNQRIDDLDRRVSGYHKSKSTPPVRQQAGPIVITRAADADTTFRPTGMPNAYFKFKNVGSRTIEYAEVEIDLLDSDGDVIQTVKLVIGAPGSRWLPALAPNEHSLYAIGSLSRSEYGRLVSFRYRVKQSTIRFGP